MILETEKFLAVLLKKAALLYGLELKIAILANLKGHRLIGQCKKITRGEYLIRLHKNLLEEFKEQYIEDVLTHEFAHAIQMELYKKDKPHSKKWKAIVEALSDKKYEKSKINYNLKKSKNYKTYMYKCECQAHNLTSIRHNKIIKRHIVYLCKKCGSKLVFEKKL